MTTPPPYGTWPSEPDPNRPADYPSGPAGSSPAGPSDSAPGYPQGDYGVQGDYGARSPGGYSGYSQPGYPQPGYPQPDYLQPGYGAPTYPQPGYPPNSAPGQPGQVPMAYHPAYPGGPVRPTRPGMATAAAVLAFVFGAFAIIASIAVLAAGSLTGVVCNDPNRIATTQVNDACDKLTSASGLLKVIAVILIVVAALMIWGGVTTLSGRNTQILTAGAVLYLVAVVVGVIGNKGFESQQVVGLVTPVLILVFLFNPAVRNWVKAKGGRTF